VSVLGACGAVNGHLRLKSIEAPHDMARLQHENRARRLCGVAEAEQNACRPICHY
jgi:hypothetical protein